MCNKLIQVRRTFAKVKNKTAGELVYTRVRIFIRFSYVIKKRIQLIDVSTILHIRDKRIDATFPAWRVPYA